METLPTPVDRAAAPTDTDLESDVSAWEEPSPFWFEEQTIERLRRYSRWAVDIFVVGAVVLFVLIQLGPGNLIANTTPAGGDMGAHVWGPAYLRDHLLPNFRLTGWTPDWYDGFPAYQFYMVVPALLIVVVNVGLRSWASLVPLLAGSGLVVGALLTRTRRTEGLDSSSVRWRWWPMPTELAVGAGVAGAVAIVVSFWVAIELDYEWWLPILLWVIGAAGVGLGLLGLALYGDLNRQPPTALTRATAVTGCPILALSTFALAGQGNPWWVPLLVAGLAVGAYVAGRIVARAVSRIGGRAWQRNLVVALGVLVIVVGVGFPYGVAFKFVSVAGLLAIPLAAYAFGRLADLPFPTPAMLSASTLIFIFNREPIPSTGNIIGGNFTSTMAGEFSFTLSLALAILYLGLMVAGFRTGRYRVGAAVVLAFTVLCHLIPGIFAIVATICAFVVWPGRRRLQWLATTLPVGGLFTAFWTLPFVGRHEFVNDMGWEKSPPKIEKFGLWEIIANRPHDNALAGDLNTVRRLIYEDYLVPNGMKAFLVLALVGLLVSIVLRVRVGLWLALTIGVLAFGFLVAPESRLWNARLLPFYYLCICLLAVIGIAELVRAIALLASSDPARPVFVLNAVAPLAVLAVLVVVVGLPLKAVGHASSGGSFDWWLFSSDAETNPGPDWAQWNYSGYENKSTYAEYYALVQTMAEVGRDRGCGRAMWEYDGDRLNGYGTPMAPMLFPYWTDGCIGSMEGLYFEASMTTPFHFINQRELSTTCSCAQRNLPYGTALDMDLGVKHLQLLGVRYYVAATQGAVAAADAHADLTPLAESGPWHVYEVADAELVEPLSAQPAVVTEDNAGMDWIYGRSNAHTPNPDHPKAEGPAINWYLDPSRWDVFLATSGPKEWQRVGADDVPDERRVDRATVSDVRTDNDTISFDVDHLGTPILVKASYFPNWKVSGADGPYRVAPNLMVVVPTSEHVRLHYGHTGVDYLAWALTLVGIGLLVVLARRRPLDMPAVTPWGETLLVRFLEGARPSAPPQSDLPPTDIEREPETEIEPPSVPPPAPE